MNKTVPTDSSQSGWIPELIALCAALQCEVIRLQAQLQEFTLAVAEISVNPHLSAVLAEQERGND